METKTSVCDDRKIDERTNGMTFMQEIKKDQSNQRERIGGIAVVKERESKSHECCIELIYHFSINYSSEVILPKLRNPRFFRVLKRTGGGGGKVVGVGGGLEIGAADSAMVTVCQKNKL